MFRNAQELLAGPRVVAQWLLALGDEACALFRCFFLGDVECFCRFWEVGDEEVAQEGNGQRDDAADDE